MLQHPAAVRAAFEEAGRTLLHTLRAIGPEQWDTPSGVGEWTVRELAAHALRGFSMLQHAITDEPRVDRIVSDAGEYYATALAANDIHAAIAQRGRDGGLALADPVGQAEPLIEQVSSMVSSMGDDDPVNTIVGQMTLTEYLATRVVEVGVHTLDLQRATGQFPELHSETSEVILSVLVGMASPVPLILALTGRLSLPPGHNVLS